MATTTGTPILRKVYSWIVTNDVRSEFWRASKAHIREKRIRTMSLLGMDMGELVNSETMSPELSHSLAAFSNW